MFKTKDGKSINVEKLSWKEAKSILKFLVPDMVDCINEVDSTPEDTFYKASYPFGTKIIRGSDVYLPLVNGGTIAINDSNLPQELIDNLAYDPDSANPLGMILSKNSELYLPINQRIMPYMVISPGDMFGLGRVLDNATRPKPTAPSSLSFSTYNLNAGVRSIFMLAKISDRIAHNKLKKAYNFDIDTPKSYAEHWSVFKEIAKKTQSPWRAEVLFFSNNFINKLRKDNWRFLYGYLNQKYRTSNPIWHNIQGWEASFSKIESAKYIEYFSAYTLDTAKHLFTIAANGAPGFRPAMDEESAPIKLIQEAYVNGYALTEYWPIIMETAQIKSTKQPLYYSLSYATLPQFNPQKFKGKTIIALESEVERCAELYQAEILSGNYKNLLSLYNAAARVKFSCYHNDPKEYQNIHHSALIAEEDERFVHNNQVGAFPSACSFLTGCIKITPQNKSE